MRLMSKGEYVIVPKWMKFMGSDKLGLNKILTMPRALARILNLPVIFERVPVQKNAAVRPKSNVQ